MSTLTTMFRHTEIDPFLAVQQQSCLEGSLWVNELPRLRDHELLVEQGGAQRVIFSLQFAKDPGGQAFAKGTIETTLSLICQRCCQAVEYPVQLATQWGFVRTDAAAMQLAKDYEPWLVTHDKIAVIDIIEEEILLSLPMIPRHGMGKC